MRLSWALSTSQEKICTRLGISAFIDPLEGVPDCKLWKNMHKTEQEPEYKQRKKISKRLSISVHRHPQPPIMENILYVSEKYAQH